MANLEDNLIVDRCPHCQVDHPNLNRQHKLVTLDHANKGKRFWGIYVCKRCGGVVIAASPYEAGHCFEIYPSSLTIGQSIPVKPKAFLEQAVNSYHAPSGAIMLAASAVDAMLKSKGYKEGSLYKRIDTAASEHLITEGMAQWAHQVRLDANDERHADDEADLPTTEDAKRAVEFALALAELLFVLPARITRGLTDTKQQKETG